MNKKWSHGCLWVLIFAFLLTGCSSTLLGRSPDWGAFRGVAAEVYYPYLDWRSSDNTDDYLANRSRYGGVCATSGEQAGTGSFFAQARTVAATTQTLSTNRGTVYVHAAVLSGLKPNGHYLYRVGDGLNWSEQKTFTTSTTASEFTFLVFGDSQSINYRTWQATLHQAYQANPHAAFMTGSGGSGRCWPGL